jgi:putative toxin-antitoxin system antitoxin component (TIGR02293 family)
MLTDYDAKSVAAVMGIAFQRSPVGSHAPGASRSRAPSRQKRERFAFTLDDAVLHVVDAGAGAGVAGLSPPSSALIEKAVARGLPRQALRHVAESLAGGDKAKVARLEWGVVPRTTLDRREAQLSPEESERTERVARLFVHARRALGTEEEAREFMTTPHPELEGRSPLDAARTDLGTRRTEQILNALEYGLAL